MTWRDRVKRGAFTREVMLLSGGTIMGQLVTVLVTPLLTRLYSPADMGLFGLYFSFVSVASVAVCLRVDLGVASARTPHEATELVVLCLGLCPVLGVVSAGLLALLMTRHVLSFNLLPLWTVWILIPALVATGVFSALRYWHVGRREFASISRSLVVQGGTRAGVSVAAGVSHAGWLGLVLGDLVGRCLGIYRLWIAAAPMVVADIASGGLRQLGARLKAAWRYPLIVLPSSVLDALGAALPIPMIATVFGPAAAGQFALAWRIATVPAGLVAASVADVFHAHSVQAQTTRSGRLRQLVQQTMLRLAIVATVVFVPLCVLAPMGFRITFGVSWHDAGVLAMLLGPLWWTSTVVSPISRLLIVIQKPALKLYFDVLFISVPLAVLYGLRAYGLQTAVAAYGLASALIYLGFAVFLWHISGSMDRAALLSPDAIAPPEVY